jgi:type VI secretion system protein ImpF
MSRLQSDQVLIASVLDRLLDDEPEVKSEPGRPRHQVMRDLKQAVRRDLENLLNTRRRCFPWPPGLTELEQSLVNYGAPDFTGANMGSSQGREQFRVAIERLIRRCEPRFKTVRVQMLDSTEPQDRTLRFRIDALLRADPAPEPVVFDSALEPTTGAFQVKGGSR